MTPVTAGVTHSHQIMPLALAVKSLVVWLLILGLAVANGLLREHLLVPYLGAVPGMVMSGVLLSILIFAVAYLLLPWLGARRPTQFILIGVGWLVLTLIFEVSFALLRGQGVADMLGAYAFRGGNLWPVVLLVTALSPWLAARLRGWI